MKIDEKIIELKNKLNELKKVKKLFPDTEIHKDRWGHERYSSKSVISKVNMAHFYHSCGCCSDAVLYVGPYFKFEGIEIYIEIYTNPENFVIGQKHAYGIGERADEDWEETLKEAGLPEIIIKETKKYFKENPPEDCDDDYYEDYYEDE